MDEPGRHHDKASQLQNDMCCMFSLKCYIQQPDSKRSHHCQHHRGEMELLLNESSSSSEKGHRSVMHCCNNGCRQHGCTAATELCAQNAYTVSSVLHTSHCNT